MISVLSALVLLAEVSEAVNNFRKQFASDPINFAIFVIVFVAGHVIHELAVRANRGELEALRAEPLQTRRVIQSPKPRHGRPRKRTARRGKGR